MAGLRRFRCAKLSRASQDDRSCIRGSQCEWADQKSAPPHFLYNGFWSVSMHIGSLLRVFATTCLIVASTPISVGGADNLVDDPSFEITKDRDQFGRVFAKWEGWNFEGDCSFAVGDVAHTGRTSGLLVCNSAGKIRLAQARDLQPGRYLISAWIRGLNIGAGAFDVDTEFMFNDKYIPLHKGGTFGWTRLTYVADLTQPAKTGPSFGLWGPGYLWIDDVSMELVGPAMAVTAIPTLGKEEAPIAPPGPLGPGVIRCPRCQHRNMPAWKKCYACGADLASQKQTTVDGPPEKLITSFEQDNPFEGGTVVAEHATDGSKSLRIDGDYAVMQAPQNWAGYDYLKVDTWNGSAKPIPFVVEIQDTGTTGYYTRVNYNTVVPPGKDTLILPFKQLYVGEKAKPGRNLILGGITRLVFIPAAAKPLPLFLDNLRLERDLAGPKAIFDDLQAFDFGPAGSPVMDGFTAITPGTIYDEGRGYGLKNARIWRAFNVLQPDPLDQDYLCIESGGLAVDVPNGVWRVVVNVDAAAGFWGEYPIWRERTILAQGKPVIMEKQNFQSFQKKYYAFWDKDDLPDQDTFDKYTQAHFAEKTFDVKVTNGQLLVEFKGENWANSVSSLVAFPVGKAEEGARFLEYVKARRRFYFDNAFKRVLHPASGDPLQPVADDTARGLVFFQRDLMKDIYYDDTPFLSETGKPLSGDAFPGQTVPLILGVVPLRDFGHVQVAIGNLAGPGAAIPAAAIETGYASFNITRVTGDGAVYTIEPRWILPRADVDMPKGVTRAFWFTIHTPPNAVPGVYTGTVTLTPRGGAAVAMPVRFTVRKGSLDPVDIPVGPYGGGIKSPWYDDDPAATAFSSALTGKSMRLMRDWGFTMFGGVPTINFSVEDGHPVLDFSRADQQMKAAGKLGFLAVDSYGAGIAGFDPYHEDLDKMKAAGYKSYPGFIRAIFTAVQKHAVENGWIPVYWNLGDEPAGDEVQKSLANAQAYRAAIPKGPPFFTIPTSLTPGKDASDPNFMLARAIGVPSLGGFDESGIRLLLRQGGDWASYSGGSRWNFGDYMYKAVTQFGLKFRIAWHWNNVMGDPYYALDSREDDYAWAEFRPQRATGPIHHVCPDCVGSGRLPRAADSCPPRPVEAWHARCPGGGEPDRRPHGRLPSG